MWSWHLEKVKEEPKPKKKWEATRKQGRRYKIHALRTAEPFLHPLLK